MSVVSLAACQSAASVPSTVAGAPANVAHAAPAASAVRVPPGTLGRRGFQDLATSAFPISALAWPISALAWPISALAWPGAPAPVTTSCGDGGTPGPGGSESDASRRTSLKNDKSPGKPPKAQCKAQIDTAAPINADPMAPPSAIAGVQPGLLQYIYGLPSGAGAGQTVGIVVANDDPAAEADLAVYRRTFGLSPCTTANGCFAKIAATASLPAPDAGWAIETSLDVDAVSAACPNCKILVVEAASNQIPDLAAAVDTAVASGAMVVNNSYGVAEAADNVPYASHYQHAGVPMTAAAGDVAYGVQFPASVPSVTAVGGTSVQQIGGGGIQEVVWPLTGSGCSAFFPKPAWQHDTGCPNRTLDDIAMIADPNEGISVYDSTLPGTARGGWSVIGGTSLASALVASMYALGGSAGGEGSNAGLYAAAAAQSASSPTLLGVTAGSNGSCSVAYLCTAAPGYDGPSGNGVPWGVGAFAPAP